MGFRTGAWATCWEVEPKSDTVTTVRLSTSRKDKATGEYFQDFSGFVAFIGTVAAKKAANLNAKDRIRLGDVEVTTSYIKDRNKTYTNFRCFSFECRDEGEQPSRGNTEEPQFPTDDNELEDRLPF